MANDNDKIVQFTGAFYGHIEPSRVLDGAKEQELSEVIVIGEHHDGSVYIAFSTEFASEVIALLERAKYRLIRDMEDADSDDIWE